MEIGYLGPRGSYSHGAALAYWKDQQEIQLCPVESFHGLLKKIREGSLHQGILPIENSSEGAVTQVMDLLLGAEELRILGEITLSVTHSLLSVGEIGELQGVYSHPQALEQCRGFFTAYYPQVKLYSCQSTSHACEVIKALGEGYGAIAQESAANTYGLKVLRRAIQDNPMNQTRFIVVGTGEQLITGRDKTSISFTFDNDSPGNLYAVLKFFAEHHVNLTRIESRPAKQEMGKYVFYIDFIGHAKENAIIQVLDKIQGITCRLRVYGSYPLGKEVVEC